MSKLSSKFNFLLISIISLFIVGCFSYKCDVCGTFVYEKYQEQVFSDQEMIQMFGDSGFQEFRENSKNDPLKFLVTFSKEKEIEYGYSGYVLFELSSNMFNFSWKGKFVRDLQSDEFDGSIKILMRKDKYGDWEIIKDDFKVDNMLIFNIVNNGISISNKSCDEFGLGSFKNTLFN